MFRCFFLSLMFQGAIPRLNAHYGRATGPIWLDYLRCTGNESTILNCTNYGASSISSFCDHGDDAGVECPSKWLKFTDANIYRSKILYSFYTLNSSSECQQLHYWFSSSGGRSNFPRGESGGLLQQPVGNSL